jgi:cytochrome oxidase Cu insertion factor (SCO1/SenC/PrrC family)
MKYKFHFIVLLTLSLLWVSHPEVNAQMAKMPSFSIVEPNGETFQSESLAKDKPILILYFSPECDDCLAFMHLFFNHITDFNDVSIVMITYLPINEAAGFIQKYHIDNYKNLVIGTEEHSLSVMKYYRIEHIPFAALYDKNGNLISLYQKEIPIKELISKLRQSQ